MTAYTTSQSGDWDADATWGGAGHPISGDTATIADTHKVTIDSGTGNEACLSLTIQDGGELEINSENTAEVKLTIDDNASASIDIQGGGTLDMNGTVTYGTIIDFAGNSNRITINLKGIIQLTYATIEGIYPTNSRVDITGATITLDHATITGYSNNRYYLYGPVTSISGPNATPIFDFQDIYYALQNSTYNFYFDEDPNEPDEDRPIVRSINGCIGRLGRVQVTGMMPLGVQLIGHFSGTANKWRVQELKDMRDTLTTFAFTGPNLAMGSCIIDDVKPDYPRGYVNFYPYIVRLIQKE